MSLVWFVSSVWFLWFSELGYLLFSLLKSSGQTELHEGFSSSCLFFLQFTSLSDQNWFLLSNLWPGAILSLIFLAQFCLAGNTVSYFNFFPLSGTFSWHISWYAQNDFYLSNLDVERLHWKLKTNSVIMPSYVMIQNLALKFDFFFSISVGLKTSLPWWDFQNPKAPPKKRCLSSWRL